MRTYDQEALKIDLQAQFGDRILTGSSVRQLHGAGEGYQDSYPPDFVFYPQNTEEVSALVKICAKHKAPVIPFGQGTSLEGHVAALKGGVTINLSEMNAVLEVNAEDLDIRVQAGLTRIGVNNHIKDLGLFFPIDPGADASIGGMASTRASGTNAVRYGTMKDNVLGLTVVTAQGDIIQTGGRARKSAAGYDLTALMVGSEGTLGIITEVSLRLYGIPEVIAAASCQFEALSGAVHSVMEMIQLGVPIARVELLDTLQMQACIDYSDLKDLNAAPTLFLEFHGTEKSVEDQIEMVREITSLQGGGTLKWSSKTEDRNALWKARHNAWFAALALKPGAKGIATDTCVPISHLHDCIMETRQDLDDVGIIAPIVGHVGDGNFHTLLLVDTDDPVDMKMAEGIVDRLCARALKYHGTITGEHGIGVGKIHWLAKEQPTSIHMMHSLKQSLDPDSILNPGKIVQM